MAYDKVLAERMARVLADEPDLQEKRMFGGLAFLLGGHMAVAATRGGLLLRISPEQREELLEDPRASPFVMQGRELAGWLDVELDGAVGDAELARWVRIGADYVRTLPPK